MHIHFIAIGGSVMHNLALALQQKGYTVSGSDDVIYEPAQSRLKESGLLPETFGWFPEKVGSHLDAVILGMHAKVDNPELLKAQELGLKIYSYPEFLYEQSKYKTRVVIGGSHGKTTITAMILHVMKYHDRPIDYVIGAQLDGFNKMVHITEENDFIVLEGDEYLSSVVDKRPKFHLYQPNIALLSGIAWDHINVFPTFDNYLEQFKIFVDSIVRGGSITYNEEDKNVSKIVEASENTIRKLAYHTPEYSIENGETILVTPDGPMPIPIFGKHNLSNLAGAKWICQNMGLDEEDFYEAMSTFTGASKRLEKLAEGKVSVAYKDFAHAPSKVKASTEAVKQQYPDRKLLAFLELHTYSSFNPEFLNEYKRTLEAAEVAAVFYLPESVKIKGLKEVSAEQIKKAFGREDLHVFTSKEEFSQFVLGQEYVNSVLLLMSSGTYGGLDMEAVRNKVINA
ncbi:UDP-N-acetylmuramate--L-alanine ligase [Arenibacter certesii]|uniref:Peptidoglycan synthetase n=1 Tax=Arenibacter certesii TaxID=228955 RepID=A0A918ING9_9FLAO|nr:Mur ligase family protein [Arenibacter certesii]GGW23949.1 peptidoglycan synthetase [Arenibacter certesii]